MSEIKPFIVENIALSHNSFQRVKNPEVSLATIGVLMGVKKKVAELFLEDFFTTTGTIAEIQTYLDTEKNSILQTTIDYEKELWKIWHEPYADDINKYNYENQVPLLYFLCPDFKQIDEFNISELSLSESFVTALQNFMLEKLNTGNKKQVGYLEMLARYHGMLPEKIRKTLQQGYEYGQCISSSNIEEVYSWVNSLIQNDDATLEVENLDSLYFILISGRNTQTILQRLITFNTIIKEIKKIRDNYNNSDKEKIDLLIAYIENSVISYQYWEELFERVEISDELQIVVNQKAELRDKQKEELKILQERGENQGLFDEIFSIFHKVKEVIDTIDDDWTFQNEFSVHWSNETIILLNFNSEYS